MTSVSRRAGGTLRHVLVTVRQWFDSDYFPEGAQTVHERPDRFEFRRCLPFAFIHLGCIGLVWVGWSWTAVAVAFALYWTRMFAITAFYHRCIAHGSAGRWAHMTEYR
jgi:stearoyl-CoA desaturase (delta-9 desaturase)